MESVLAGFILVFLLIFGITNFSQAILTSQATLASGWEAMYTRNQLQYQTDLDISAVNILNNGTTVAVTVANLGESRLMDFDRWDVVMQYNDHSLTPMRRILYVPYSNSPTNNEWTVTGLFINNLAQTAEVFEPSIFNPGEIAQLIVKLSEPIGEGQASQLVIGLPTGGRVSTMFVRNNLPQLTANNGIALLSGQSVTISATELATSDVEQSASELTYTVTTPPAQGLLSLTNSFTQAQIDAGLLTYTHVGTGNDSFEFTVTDGFDVIGTYTFLIMVV